MTTPLAPDIQKALEAQDPYALAAAASKEDLDRIRSAGELIDLDQRRRKARTRIAVASQVLIGWVAIAGFFVNAYQSYNNKVQVKEQRDQDQARWDKEFQRAQNADKYRAFFETSVLATDANNPDKRLVGYALMQEFVSDNTYNTKATLMLEEALAQELRSNTKQGIDEPHRNAVVAIVTALSETDDCSALQRAAKSFDRIASRHARFGDSEETGEIFRVYVRRLLGRSVEKCTSFSDFRDVRRPLRDTLIKIPEIAGLKGPVTPEQANAALVTLLRDRCLDEVTVNGASECPEIFQSYAHLCEGPYAEEPRVAEKSEKAKERRGKETKAALDPKLAARQAKTVPEETGACGMMRELSQKYPVPSGAASGGSR